MTRGEQDTASSSLLSESCANGVNHWPHPYLARDEVACGLHDAAFQLRAAVGVTRAWDRNIGACQMRPRRRMRDNTSCGAKSGINGHEIGYERRAQSMMASAIWWGEDRYDRSC